MNFFTIQTPIRMDTMATPERDRNHLVFVAVPERATPALVALSGTATNTKWFLSLFGVAIVSILIGVWIVKKFIIKGN